MTALAVPSRTLPSAQAAVTFWNMMMGKAAVPMAGMDRSCYATFAGKEVAVKPLLPESVCPRCGYKTDAATMLEDDHAVPKPGDVSICMKCAHVRKFGADLRLVELTGDETVELATDSDFMEHFTPIQSAIEQAGQEPHRHGGKAL